MKSVAGPFAGPRTITADGVGQSAAWAVENREAVEALLDEHGAILFRGFGVDTPDLFEQFALGLNDELFPDYGDLPLAPDARSVYNATPYPARRSILFHNEGSHLHEWPRKQVFCCVTPPEEGGATPIVDGEAAYAALSAGLRAPLEEQGLLYCRRFVEGVDVPWQQFYRTHDREEVTRRCRAEGTLCEWTPAGDLRTSRRAAAVIRHPRTSRTVLFHQIQLHHASCLEPSVRGAMQALFGSEDGFPRSVAFGDGTRIPDEAVAELSRLYESLAARSTWERGDVLLLDNMRFAHGRDPYRGERRVLVALADIRTSADAG